MDLGLAGKVAIVTGASRGIGRGIALALGREGCRLVVCARGEVELEAAAGEIRGTGAEVAAVALDLTEAEAGERLAAAARERFGRVDLLVNNVGGNRRKPLAETTDEDWRELFEWNVLTHVRCARAVIPEMVERRSGVLLFISSIFGREAGGVGLALYNTTKSAVISAAKILSLELAPHNVRALAVAPGSIRFPGGSWDRRALADPEGIAQFVAANLPLGRFGTVEEVADVVAFLASERASLVTGACVTVDGGQSRSLV